MHHLSYLPKVNKYYTKIFLLSDNKISQIIQNKQSNQPTDIHSSRTIKTARNLIKTNIQHSLNHLKQEMDLKLQKKNMKKT